MTLTTVGYGDIVPQTTTGRVAGVFLMITAIATLGIISGTLAGFFAPKDDDDDTSTTAADGTNAQILDQLTTLRDQLAALEAKLPQAPGNADTS